MNNTENFDNSNLRTRIAVDESGDITLIQDTVGVSLVPVDAVEIKDISTKDYTKLLKQAKNSDLSFNAITSQIEALRYNKGKESVTPIPIDVALDEPIKGVKIG